MITWVCTHELHFSSADLLFIHEIPDVPRGVAWRTAATKAFLKRHLRVVDHSWHIVFWKISQAAEGCQGCFSDEWVNQQLWGSTVRKYFMGQGISTENMLLAVKKRYHTTEFAVSNLKLLADSSLEHLLISITFSVYLLLDDPTWQAPRWVCSFPIPWPPDLWR